MQGTSQEPPEVLFQGRDDGGLSQLEQRDWEWERELSKRDLMDPIWVVRSTGGENDAQAVAWALGGWQCPCPDRGPKRKSPSLAFPLRGIAKPSSPGQTGPAYSLVQEEMGWGWG